MLFAVVGLQTQEQFPDDTDKIIVRKKVKVRRTTPRASSSPSNLQLDGAALDLEIARNRKCNFAPMQ